MSVRDAFRKRGEFERYVSEGSRCRFHGERVADMDRDELLSVIGVLVEGRNWWREFAMQEKREKPVKGKS